MSHTTHLRDRLRDVIAAPVVPYTDDGHVDEEAYAEHVEQLVATERLAGLLVNGHTGDILLLRGSERRRLVEVARKVAGNDIIIIGGTHGQSTWEALEEIEGAAEAGADCAEVFAPFAFGRGATEHPDVLIDYYSELDQQAALPFLFMQYPPRTNLGMPTATMEAVAALPNVVGVKQAVGDVALFEEQGRKIRSMEEPIAYLTAWEGALMTAFTLGCDGALVGIANFVDLVADLWDVAEAGDLERIRAANDRLYPISSAVYAHPSFRWGTRLKYALWRAGIVPTPTVRSPITPVTDAEAQRIDEALEQAQLA